MPSRAAWGGACWNAHSRRWPATVRIVATIDPRAIARYLRAGLDGRVPWWAGKARRATNDFLRSGPLADRPGDPPLDELAEVDRAILGFRRDEDHAGSRAATRLDLPSDGGGGRLRLPPSRPAWGGPYAALPRPTTGPDRGRRGGRAAAAGHANVTFDLALTARPRSITCSSWVPGRSVRDAVTSRTVRWTASTATC